MTGTVSPDIAAEDEVVDLASELIRIDTSNTGEPDTVVGEQEAAEYVAAKLEEVGYEVELVESGAPRRMNVFARLKGADPERGAWTWSRRTRASGPCTRSRAPCRTATCGAAAPST
jgi:acetylornithine deacetylase/succinyl-diaminopimelate desuccinylase-like protein